MGGRMGYGRVAAPADKRGFSFPPPGWAVSDGYVEASSHSLKAGEALIFSS